MVTLLSLGIYRLVDFDNCRRAKAASAGNTTLEICPPEIATSLINEEGRREVSSTGHDIWALGCVL